MYDRLVALWLATVEGEPPRALKDAAGAWKRGPARQFVIEGGWPLIKRLLAGGSGLVFDVKMKLDRTSKPAGIELWRL